MVISFFLVAISFGLSEPKGGTDKLDNVANFDNQQFRHIFQ